MRLVVRDLIVVTNTVFLSGRAESEPSVKFVHVWGETCDAPGAHGEGGVYPAEEVERLLRDTVSDTLDGVTKILSG